MKLHLLHKYFHIPTCAAHVLHVSDLFMLQFFFQHLMRQRDSGIAQSVEHLTSDRRAVRWSQNK